MHFCFYIFVKCRCHSYCCLACGNTSYHTVLVYCCNVFISRIPNHFFEFHLFRTKCNFNRLCKTPCFHRYLSRIRNDFVYTVYFIFWNCSHRITAAFEHFYRNHTFASDAGKNIHHNILSSVFFIKKHRICSIFIQILHWDIHFSWILTHTGNVPVAVWRFSCHIDILPDFGACKLCLYPFFRVIFVVRHPFRIIIINLRLRTQTMNTIFNQGCERYLESHCCLAVIFGTKFLCDFRRPYRRTCKWNDCELFRIKSALFLPGNSFSPICIWPGTDLACWFVCSVRKYHQFIFCRILIKFIIQFHTGLVFCIKEIWFDTYDSFLGPFFKMSFTFFCSINIALMYPYPEFHTFFLRIVSYFRPPIVHLICISTAALVPALIKDIVFPSHFCTKVDPIQMGLFFRLIADTSAPGCNPRPGRNSRFYP